MTYWQRDIEEQVRIDCLQELKYKHGLVRMDIQLQIEQFNTESRGEIRSNRVNYGKLGVEL
jgi:hypothetical protein